MTVRSRSIQTPRVSGQMGFYNQASYNSYSPAAYSVYGGYQACDDLTGHEDCQPFTVNRHTTQGGILQKTGGGAWFHEYVTDALRNPAFGSHLFVSGVPSDFAAATQAAARTNPSRPYVDVPVDVLDTRAGLQSIKEAGENIIRSVAHHNLNYQFMIAPLVGDIVRLHNATQQIDRRVNEIRRLYQSNGHGIRRTVHIGDYSERQPFTVFFQSQGFLAGAVVQVWTQVSKSVHIRWSPSEETGIAPAPDLARVMAIRSVYGATVDLSTLWEIMPWSWLFDWFGNVGSYLRAKRNIVPARVVGVYPMTHTRTICEWQGYPLTGIDTGYFSGGNSIRETKTRVVSAVSLDASLNFLSGNQMGLLASIAATRR